MLVFNLFNRYTNSQPQMSGLSNFAVQFHSWFFKTKSKFNDSPNSFFNCKVKVQMKSKQFEKYSLFTTKVLHLFSINSVQIWPGS